MTLFKQIIIILSFFQTTILGVVMWLNFNTANEFINTQLKFDAMHTANSLGLSITPAASQNDIATIETMINSMFDSGYFETISLENTEGEMIVKNHQPTIIADVPNWFVKLINMQAPIANSNIMAGWVPYGTLHVQNSTGLAYRQLWTTFKDIGISFIIISLLAFIILHQSLKFILKPLKKVQEQAEAITGNDFILQNKLPSTIELKQVVTAMNAMISKVKDIFDQEADTVEKYYALLYKDTNTNLHNRRYFKLKFEEYLESEEEFFGSVIFANLHNEQKLKSNLGFKRSHNLLQEVSNIFTKVANSSDFSVAAYMEDWDFAFLLPTLKRNKIEALFKSINSELNQLITSFGLNEKEYFFHFGATKYQAESSISEIFAQADFALSAAKANTDSFKLYWNEIASSEAPLGKDAWREEILAAMDEHRLMFAIQRVVDQKHEIYHNELFLRLKDKDENIHNAGYFMPTVRELNLITLIDKYVLKRVIYGQKNTEFPPVKLSINISKKTILHLSQYDWLEEILEEFQKHSHNLINFEISSQGQIDTKVLTKTSKWLRSFGITIGLDNFSLDGGNLKFLQDVNPDYIKIRSSSILDLFKDEEAVSSKQSLNIITGTMDIKVIAVGVETQKEREKLQDIGINYFQGSLIEEPYLI